MTCKFYAKCNNGDKITHHPLYPVTDPDGYRVTELHFRVGGKKPII